MSRDQGSIANPLNHATDRTSSQSCNQKDGRQGGGWFPQLLFDLRISDHYRKRLETGFSTEEKQREVEEAKEAADLMPEDTYDEDCENENDDAKSINLEDFETISEDDGNEE